MLSFRGRHVAVLGLGRSNRPLIEYLLARGALVTARDRSPREDFGELAEQWESMGVRLIFGDRYLDDIEEDILFRSPGIRPNEAGIQAAIDRGAILTSEMELFFEACPATILGVTGSDGKTTTTTLAGLFLEEECRRRELGNVFVGGNIGEPLLPHIDLMKETDFAVAELSSFQLQTMHLSPTRAAITNVTPNHLNWHGTFENYTAAKTNIFTHPGIRLLVLNAENEQCRSMARWFGGAVSFFSSKKSSPAEFEGLVGRYHALYYLRDGYMLHWDGETERRMLAVKDILLLGVHNIENCMTAMALTEGLVSPESIHAVMTTFSGVRHRIEPVRELHGVKYYNSSIDTSPTRTAAALAALAPARPIVICGGYDKLIPFEPLAEVLYAHAGKIILTGATRHKIYDALMSCPDKTELPIHIEPDFTAAVRLAKSLAQEGDIVLLSPACAGFDAFKDFAERGDTFCRLVREFE